MINKRRGFVVPFALIVAAILLTSSFFLSKSTTHTINVKQKSLADLQNQYAVKAAMQHAMLKCLLMPTQLYDAAAFSGGRNPYFDFTEYTKSEFNNIKSIFGDPIEITSKNGSKLYIKRASNANPGPRFIAKNPSKLDDEDDKRWSQIKSFSNTDLQKSPHVTSWPAGIKNPDIYLWKYYSDLNFDSSSAAVSSKNLVYPYPFKYSVLSMELSALDEQRKYNEEAIKIVVAGTTQYRRSESSMVSDAVVTIRRN